MKKVYLLFLSLLLLTACGAPKQLTPNWQEEIVGLEDIPEQNMPGYKHPEPRLECIAPCLFGLDYNPCCKVKKPKPVEPPKTFSWLQDPEEVLTHAGGERMVLVLFRRSEADSQQIMNALDSKCARRELDRHYSGLLIDGDEALYRILQHSSEGALKWLPGDFIMSPTLMFVKTEVVGPSNNRHVEGKSLPISFEGRIDINMCVLLDAFYESGTRR